MLYPLSIDMAIRVTGVIVFHSNVKAKRAKVSPEGKSLQIADKKLNFLVTSRKLSAFVKKRTRFHFYAELKVLLAAIYTNAEKLKKTFSLHLIFKFYFCLSLSLSFCIPLYILGSTCSMNFY